MRFTLALFTLCAGLLCASCTGQIDEPLDNEDAEDGAKVVLDPEPADLTAPIELLALASDETELREVPTYAQVLDDLDSDEELMELRNALGAAGWSTEECAGLVTAAAGHGSGAEHDEVRARNLDSRNEIGEAFDLFEEELALAEAEAGVSVDRGKLFAEYFTPEAVR